MSDHVDDALLSRLIDADLSLTSREAVLSHLSSCPQCAQHHDRLVSVAAALRMEPPVQWTEANSTAVVSSLTPRRRVAWPVLAAMVASVGLFALAATVAAPLMAPLLAGFKLFVLLADAPVPAGVASALPGVIVVVAAVAILAPLAAYPLARWR